MGKKRRREINGLEDIQSKGKEGRERRGKERVQRKREWPPIASGNPLSPYGGSNLEDKGKIWRKGE